jgi:transcriptional regulator with XRE-family HTH domain
MKFMTGNTIGDRLKQARELCGLSAREVSRRAGLTEAVCAQIERGVSDAPELGTLNALALVLEVRPEWLTYGSGPMRLVVTRRDGAA